jgi:NADH-ubiquinone oxidoreductase chain 2
LLLLNLIFLLLANAVTLIRAKSILFNRVGLIILLDVILINYDSLLYLYIDRGISVYGGLFHTTAITQTFDMFIIIVSVLILQLTAFYPRYISGNSAKLILNLKNNLKEKFINKGEQFTQIEYPLIILFILLGATLLMSSGDLVSMFLSLELQSYGLYILCTLYRNSELSTSAGLTYFLLGGLSSCFILLGSSIIYMNTGVTNFDNIYILGSFFDKSMEPLINIEPFTSQYLNIALIIMSVGYLFKVASAPFHF